MDEKTLIREIEEHRDEYIEFLKRMIQVDTYNPPGNEKNLVPLIKEYLEEENIDCEVFPFQENRANLLATLNKNAKGSTLLLNGHMDVVPPGNKEEWKYEPLLAFQKRKKYIYGRGAADMKGGLAAMIITLKLLKKLQIETSGNLILNAVSDEETGGEYGTGWCMEHLLEERNIKTDFCIIGEPTGLSPLPKAVILGEKGHLQVKIICNGISCHASMPEMGKNAIYMMNEIIQNLPKLEEYIPKVEPPLTVEELQDLVAVSFPSKDIFLKIYNEQELLQNVVASLTKFTYAFTVVHAGIKENVVPDNCEGIIDFRLIPGQSTEMILDGLKKIIQDDLGYEIRENCKGKPEDIFVCLEIFHQSDPSIWEEWKDSEELKEFYSVVEEVYKKKPFYFLFPACADAHYLRNGGYCPQTILFGPGSASTAHSVDEFIEIEDFINCIKAYALFAYKFLTQAE
ncbi:MAG: M20 family peptidase [Promethearchaeota archaeon]|nr:MAG: M20 family peptidase [Candidatus Lokiarchaeota archaeon]